MALHRTAIHDDQFARRFRRQVGVCPACGDGVRLEDNFVRVVGSFFHVMCVRPSVSDVAPHTHQAAARHASAAD